MVRALLIGQLCLAFMMLVWYAFFPFMGELYHYRSRLFLAQTVTGDVSLVSYVPEKEKDATKRRLLRYQTLYQALPAYRQEAVLKDIRHYETKLSTPWQAKVKSSLAIFLHHLPPFQVAWIMFSLVICLTILYRVEGAAPMAWILPFLSLCTVLENQSTTPPLSHIEERFFPDEKIDDVEHFLLKNFGQEGGHLDEAAFAFNLERLEALRKDSGYESAYLFRSRKPLPLLLLFFSWNLIFAYIIMKKEGDYDQKSAQYIVDSTHHAV